MTDNDKRFLEDLERTIFSYKFGGKINYEHGGEHPPSVIPPVEFDTKYGDLSSFLLGKEEYALPEVTVEATHKNKPLPEQVQAQLDYLGNSKEFNKRPFGIVDKKENTIFYFDENLGYVRSEPVATGKDNKDVDTGLGVREAIKQGKAGNMSEYIDYLEQTDQKITPSGRFTLKYRNVAEPLRHLRYKVYGGDEAYERDKAERAKNYGKEGHMFTMQDQFGVWSNKAVHGTESDIKKKAFKIQDPKSRDLSGGCINVKGKTICFDHLKDDS
jgi:hypothetical protein